MIKIDKRLGPPAGAASACSPARASQLARLAESLALLSSRLRLEAAGDDGTLREKFGGAIRELVRLRDDVARRIAAGDRRSDELRTVHAALSDLSAVFDLLPVRRQASVAISRPQQRRRALRAARLDASMRKLLHRATVALGLSATTAAVVGGTMALANPAGCMPTLVTIYCTGDYSAGINLDEVPPFNYFVDSLTEIAPASGHGGIGFTGSGVSAPVFSSDAGSDAPGMTLDADLRAFGLRVTDAYGIGFFSSGGGGSQGSDDEVRSSTAAPGIGGNGGKGGSLLLTVSGAITTFGTGAAGLLAVSAGGHGGDGGNVVGPFGSRLFPVGIRGPIYGAIGGDGSDAASVTVRNSAAITTWGTNSAAIQAESRGGSGGLHGDGVENSFPIGSLDRGAPGVGGLVTVTNSGAIVTHGLAAFGIFANSFGGYGGHGSLVTVTSTGGITILGDAAAGIMSRDFGDTGSNGSDGTSGLPGEAAGPVTLISDVRGGPGITTSGVASQGVLVISLGGGGGSGSSRTDITASGSFGAAAGDGGAITLTHYGAIATTGAQSAGIYAISKGGKGGDGGNANGASAHGGPGAAGGSGGAVFITNNGFIQTVGDQSFGVAGRSFGGNGGNGGSGGGISATGGGGNASGRAGKVTIVNTNLVRTSGENAYGLYAQSIGGFSGGGGSGSGLVGFGGSGSNGGDGGEASITNAAAGTVQTRGANSSAVFVQSVGGGGGDGGSGSGIAGLGTSGNSGGFGAAVMADNAGSLVTLRDFSRGIFAQSIGGGGGNGGSGSGLVGIGGSGSGTSAGGAVSVLNSGEIGTLGKQSQGIFAQSIGGGGGDGGTGSGLISFGGSGGGGGNGAAVTVTNSGRLSTFGAADSSAIFAQSVGGGGGNGGNAYSNSPNISFAFGGSGGTGGQGGAVTVNSTTADILTAGDRSRGIQAQSIGGGGGNGGAAVSTSTGQFFSASLAFGGRGGSGGNASDVTIVSGNHISTFGADAHGIFGQSIGGGGGAGGFAIAGAFSDGATLSLAMGGTGGNGGQGKAVTVTTQDGGLIETSGFHAYGIIAQSVGGGGGDGGFSITTSGAAVATLGASVGGNGAGGGKGGAVSLFNHAGITTKSNESHAIFAQSVGGGGGSGGFSITSGVSGGFAASAAIGGGGSGGGDGDAVLLTSESGAINTSGFHAFGILAQSVGGGGGDGGFSIASSLAVGANANFAIGRRAGGGGGGNGSTVTLNNASAITTLGDISYGILAQSVGGGGGSGGFAIASGASATSTGGISLAMGGAGGSGGIGAFVGLINAGAVTTSGSGSHALVAQSIGGGGGSGGFAGAFNVALGGGVAISSSIGGSGGAGGNGGVVELINSGLLETSGIGAYGVLAQSVGGGGGDGGWSMAIAASVGSGNAALALSVGGSGGVGGSGNTVSVFNSQGITTQGRKAHGILAQSIGGGGGDGGWSASGSFTPFPDGVALSVSVGGKGGAGGIGKAVTVNNSAAIMTGGEEAFAIFAQSVGGGGGDGGASFTGSLAGPAAKNLSLSLGGNGGGGNDGGAVSVVNSGALSTTGLRGRAIFAQSVGGGGGTGGLAVAATFDVAARGVSAYSLALAIGGKGGSGGIGNDVMVDNSGAITTTEDDATAIYLQSIGGGGGAGGAAFAGSAAVVPPGFSANVAVTVAVGGAGGNGNNGKAVTATNSAKIKTSGDNAHGIFAQSVGGGGGSGGSTRTMQILLGVPIISEASANYTLALSIGGNGGGASNGGLVDLSNRGDIETSGADSFGIFGQSIGGGGGTGGEASHGFYGAPTVGINRVGFFSDLQVVVGGQAGAAGNGGVVGIANTGTILTHGDGAGGIFGQSVGGGGGIGGVANGGLTGKIVIAGQGGAAGDGGAITIGNTKKIETFGIVANGIEAQSIGGGGGKGGNINRGFLGFGALPTFGLGGGSAGNGGAVTIDSSGDIITHGVGSIGIVAQSVGGGGGAAGDLGAGLGYMGSAGGAGSAGAVTVNQTGNITTFGENAHGIVAQSAAGRERKVDSSGRVSAPDDASNTGPIVQAHAGDVSVTVSGTIDVSGLNASGIIAQSLGGTSNGNITIAIGGSVTGGTDSGTAINIMDGATNTVTIHGTVATHGDPFGNAIISSSGNETIDNYGTLTGNINLGGGVNAFNNKAGGIVSAGTIFMVNGVLDNAGVFSAGRVGRAGTTALTGSYRQEATGSLDIDMDVAADYLTDRLNISGTADMAGAISIFLRNPETITEGTHTATIIHADGGLIYTGPGLVAPYSPFFVFDLLFPNANEAVLSLTISFDRASLTGGSDASLGTNTLRLSDASGVYSGVLSGSGGLKITGGAQTLTGVNTYSGLTIIDAGDPPALLLVGNGSISNSAAVINNSIFDISGTNTGTSIKILSGNGETILGSKTLTLTAAADTFAGVISGAGGGLTIAAGTETLSGANTYSGRTIIDAGAALALAGGGSIAGSGVTDNGSFDISGTTAGAAVVTLSGAGAVVLGDKTLTLTGASDTFAGTLGGIGGLTVAGGSEALSGANAYTGRTVVNAGATLALDGAGSIAASSGLTDNGTFDISATAGTAIKTLSGTGTIALGAQTLILTAAAESFAGTIGGSGGVTIAGGLETFTAANAYSGLTTIDAGTALILSGQGSIAASSGVVANGGFGIAGTAAGVAITTLSGTGVVGLGARTLTLTAASGTFSGVIGDSGGLTLTGGAEVLSGANVYGGVTTIASGAQLALTGAGSIAASSGVVDDGVFDISGTASGAAITSLSGGGAVALGSQTLTLIGAQGTFSGSIGGTGGLAILGGSLALTGISTYSGGTLISTANLSVSGDAALGSGPLAMANGQLTALANVTSTRAISLTGAGSFNTNLKTMSLGGVVSGTGALIAAGGGTLILAAGNTYGGGTSIIEHTTLVVGADSALGAASGALEIIDGKLQASADFSSTRSIVIGPNGAIDANGHTLNFGGPITLDSDSGTPLFTGSTSVAGAWTFTPQDGLLVTGTLQGVGIVSQQTTIAGTLSPGNSPGTITFTAPVIMLPVSTLALDVDGPGTGTGAGNYDRVVVQGAGNTFAANGQMVVKLRGISGSANNTYTPRVGQRFNVVHADAGVVGGFASLAQPVSGLAPGTRFDTIYSTTDIDLVTTPASYASLAPLGIADTGNRRSLGASIDSYRLAPGFRATGDRAQLLAALYSLPSASIGGAMDRMAGTVHGDALATALSLNRMLSAGVDGHDGGGMTVAMIGRLPYGDFAAINAPAAPKPAIAGGSPFWALGVGAWSTTAGDGNAPGYSSNAAGIVAGVDLLDKPDGRLGIAGGFARAELDTRAAATARVQAERLIAYGNLVAGDWHIDGEMSVAAGQFDSTRTILLGLLTRIAKGRSDGWAYAAAAGAHYGDGDVVPFVELRYDYVSRAAFTETGAGDFSLAVDDEIIRTPRSRVGLDLKHVFGGTSADDALALKVRLAWDHDFSRTAGQTDASLIGAPAVPFRAFSAKRGEDAGVVGVAASAHIDDTISLFGGYQLEVRSGSTSQAVSVGLRANW